MSDHDIEHAVTEELHSDPKLDEKAIVIASTDGVITLRGTVGSFREKRAAQKAAARVSGVRSVKNDLKVRLLTDHGRGDADLRGDVLRALQLDRVVPDSVDARVDDGWVTLEGTATRQFQREEAEKIAGNIAGVLGVDDRIELSDPAPSSGDMKEGIEKALKRSDELDAEDGAVDTRGGTAS